MIPDPGASVQGDRVAKNVFILGAGASRQAGGPLMRDFLDTTERVLKRDDPDVVAVLGGLASLRRSYAFARLDLLNIESLLSCFEMAELLGGIAGIEPETAAQLPVALRRVMTKTLNESIRCERGPYYSFPPAPYPDFASSVLVDLQYPAVITFNYDLALELAMACCEAHGRRFPLHADYALSTPDPDTYHIPVLKLHGSLNWTRCAKCSTIVALPVTDVLAGDANFYGKRVDALRLSEALGTLVHCDEACKPEPVIVPPTLAKSSHHTSLAKVWQRAGAEMAGVRNLFVIGYSLPETDFFFRYFFGLGTIGATLKRICVIDPSPAVLKERFQSFLGPEALPYLEMVPGTFADSIPYIKASLRKEDNYW
jgi:hypothetical protein